MKEQIEEMAKIICKPTANRGNCEKCGFKKQCSKFDDATDLYNAGYRKQKEGEWVFVEEEDFIYCICRCSSCGKEVFFGEDETLYDFCPNCGAKMKGGAE